MTDTLLEDLIVTPAAGTMLKEICDTRGYSPEIRLGVQGGGCSGLEYTFDMKSESFDGDRVFSFPDYGISISVDPMSLDYVRGMTIDYLSDFMRQGFVFLNPQATQQCGCGNSFGV